MDLFFLFYPFFVLFMGSRVKACYFLDFQKFLQKNGKKGYCGLFCLDFEMEEKDAMYAAGIRADVSPPEPWMQMPTQRLKELDIIKDTKWINQISLNDYTSSTMGNIAQTFSFFFFFDLTIFTKACVLFFSVLIFFLVTVSNSRKRLYFLHYPYSLIVSSINPQNFLTHQRFGLHVT